MLECSYWEGRDENGEFRSRGKFRVGWFLPPFFRKSRQGWPVAFRGLPTSLILIARRVATYLLPADIYYLCLTLAGRMIICKIQMVDAFLSICDVDEYASVFIRIFET